LQAPKSSARARPTCRCGARARPPARRAARRGARAHALFPPRRCPRARRRCRTWTAWTTCR
jgi:hypothetical protein